MSRHRTAVVTLISLLVGSNAGGLSFAADVTVCDEASLVSSVAAGGMIRFGCNGTIALTQPLVITNEVVLDGAGRDVRLSGANRTRLFVVEPGGKLQLRFLTVQDGRGRGKAAFDGTTLPARGGAILNEGGIVEVFSCLISNNIADGSLFDFPQPGESFPQEGRVTAGGAIYNAGTLRVDGSTFVGNVASGSSHIGLSTLANPGAGGAVYHASGSVTISRSIFSSNFAVGGIGSLDSVAGKVFSDSGRGFGGAIYAVAGTATFDDVLFQQNAARPGQSFRDLAARSTYGSCCGGAILSFTTNTLVNCRFIGNEAGTNLTIVPDRSFPGVGFGGAAAFNGPVAMTDCTISGNTAWGGVGGGIVVSNLLNLTNCTIDHNLARGLDAEFAISRFSSPGSSGYGGGLRHSGSGSLVNCTIAENSAVAGVASPSFFAGREPGVAGGGGIFHDGSTLSIINCTIASNTTTNRTQNGTASGSGLFAAENVAIGNTILAHNSGGSNVWGGVTDLGRNLSSDTTPVFNSTGSHNEIDPLLLRLSENGGKTRTIGLQFGSPALDAADPLLAPPTDQRGMPRPAGPGADIGAFEGALLYLRITGHDKDVVAFEFMGNSTDTYQLQRSSDLRTWLEVVTTNLPAGMGQLKIAPSEPLAAFFRITRR